MIGPTRHRDSRNLVPDDFHRPDVKEFCVMAVTGQFYYLGQGGVTDARLAYVNVDASAGSNTNSATTILFHPFGSATCRIPC